MAQYSLAKSAAKAVKYPIFGVVVAFILKALEVSVLGMNIQFPKEVNLIMTNPALFLGLAVVIFLYDWLKHKVEVNLP